MALHSTMARSSGSAGTARPRTRCAAGSARQPARPADHEHGQHQSSRRCRRASGLRGAVRQRRCDGRVLTGAPLPAHFLPARRASSAAPAAATIPASPPSPHPGCLRASRPRPASFCSSALGVYSLEMPTALERLQRLGVVVAVDLLELGEGLGHLLAQRPGRRRPAIPPSCHPKAHHGSPAGLTMLDLGVPLSTMAPADVFAAVSTEPVCRLV